MNVQMPKAEPVQHGGAKRTVQMNDLLGHE
jgi:hypothetical protein